MHVFTRAPITQLLFVSILLTSSTTSQPQWRDLPNAPVAGGGRHDDVFFINPDTGWVVNGGGLVYRTLDGGMTWDNTFAASEYLRCVGFGTYLNGWAGTLSDLNPLYATADGGETWAPVSGIPDPAPKSICGISVVGDSVVYAVGAYYGFPRVVKSTDAGNSWTTFNLAAYAEALVDCYFFHRDSGFVVGSTDSLWTSGEGEAVVVFTSDGGNSWEQRHVGTRPGELCWKISFPSDSVGFVSIEDFTSSPDEVYFLKTTDRGMSWQENLFQSFHYDEQGIGFATPSIGWIGGWGGDTYESTDGGNSWHLAGFGFYMNRFRFLSDTLGYAVGESVYKYSNEKTTGDVKHVPEGRLTGFYLAQNYPNPFNSSTTWRFNLDRTSFVDLRVYDALGQEVALLIKEDRDPGTYEVTFHSRGLASGVYLYRLVAGTFSDSKRMLLLR